MFNVKLIKNQQSSPCSRGDIGKAHFLWSDVIRKSIRSNKTYHNRTEIVKLRFDFIIDKSSTFKRHRSGQIMAKRYNKLGVALGGGAAFGAAHIGVLKAFEELEIQPDYISGTSIGAFVAAHYAFGTSLEELEDIGVDLDWLDITGFKLSAMGLLSNERLGKGVIEQIGEVTIEESKIPLCMISTNICTGKKIVLKKGPLHKAVMASTCLPGVFVPVEWDDMLLVDGVLCENVPVSPLREMGAEDVIAVDLTTNRKYKCPEDIIDVMTNTFDIGLNNMIQEQLEDDQTTLIQIELTAYNKADTGKAENLIREGYEATMNALE